MWPNPQKSVDLVTFIEKILDGKLHFLCIVIQYSAKIDYFKNDKKIDSHQVMLFDNCSVTLSTGFL